MFIGDRIKFRDDNRIATIRYIGEVEGKEGQYVGLELNGPTGKHNGTVDGKKYFECKDLHGILMPRWKLNNSITSSKEKEITNDKENGIGIDKEKGITNDKENGIGIDKENGIGIDKEKESLNHKGISIDKYSLNDNYSCNNIVKETLYKSKVRKLKRENESLKKDLINKDKLLEKFKDTTSNLLNKISDFEVEAKKIIEEITSKVSRLKTKEMEEEEYFRMCTLFKNIIISSIENNVEGVETNLKEYQEILQKNDN